MVRFVLAAILSGGLWLSALAAPAGQEALDSPENALRDAMRQAVGAPARADLADQATLRLEQDLLFVPKEPAERVLNASHIAIPKHFVALLVGSQGMDAAGILTFVPAGFVDSDTAIAWTPDDILASLRHTVEHRNAARINQGLEPLDARRWVLPPSYEPERHRISWAAIIIPKSEPRGSDGEVIFNAVAFGRQGYIKLAVASSEQNAEPVKEMLTTFLGGLSFKPGKAYGDNLPGEPRSPEGLAGAMGIETLAKADTASSGGGSSDRLLPIVGGTVAVIGAFALFFNIHRQMRRNSRRV